MTDAETRRRILVEALDAKVNAYESKARSIYDKAKELCDMSARGVLAREATEYRRLARVAEAMRDEIKEGS